MSKNQQFQKQYDEFQSKIEQLNTKVVQIDADLEEHKVVLDTLQGVPKERKCFRMVGGALIEKTAGETIPVLESNIKNMTEVVQNLSTELKSTQENFIEWKQKNNVKIVSGNQ